MVWGSKLLLAFDAASVQGARLAQRLRGPELQAMARRALGTGALHPLALGTNIVRADEVREAARAVVAELGGGGRAGILVLPDGVARLALVDVPKGSDAREYARFRLSSQLPYPAAEAVVDLTPAGPGRFLAAAVRRDVAAEYEAMGEAAGLGRDRVDLMPLAALAVLRRGASAGPRIDVVLGEAAFSMALFGGGVAVALRSRRRDPGPDEPERIRREVERTALLGEHGTSPSVRVVGAGARRVAEALCGAGVEARAGWGNIRSLASGDAEEAAWLGAGFAP
jgi:hypothetical protein